MSLGERKKRV